MISSAKSRNSRKKWKKKVKGLRKFWSSLDSPLSKIPDYAKISFTARLSKSPLPSKPNLRPLLMTNARSSCQRKTNCSLGGKTRGTSRPHLLERWNKLHLVQCSRLSRDSNILSSRQGTNRSSLEATEPNCLRFRGVLLWTIGTRRSEPNREGGAIWKIRSELTSSKTSISGTWRMWWQRTAQQAMKWEKRRDRGRQAPSCLIWTVVASTKWLEDSTSHSTPGERASISLAKTTIIWFYELLIF